MKALTLCQPWASAVAWGEKAIEHRSWPTRYRGPLLIHASSRPYTLELEDGEVMPLPYSAIIARVILADVHLFTQADCEGACMETALPGYAWVLADPVQVQPVRAKGKLNLWEWVGELEDLPTGGICHVEAWHTARAGVVIPPA